MFHSGKIKVIFWFILFFCIIATSCNKDNKNTIRVQGRVFDPNTNRYVSGVSVVLAASKVSSGGIFSSGYEDIATMTTDADGNFACECKEEKFSGYQFTLSKDHYFGLIQQLTTSDIVAGTTYSPTFSLYPECFIWMEVRNIIPETIYDHISYSFTGGSLTCFECCDNILNHGYGMNFADTLICKTHGNQNVTLSYNVTKGGITQLHTITHYCSAFDTTKFIVSY